MPDDALWWLVVVILLIGLTLPRVYLHAVGVFGLGILSLYSYGLEQGIGPITGLNIATGAVHLVMLILVRRQQERTRRGQVPAAQRGRQ